MWNAMTKAIICYRTTWLERSLDAARLQRYDKRCKRCVKRCKRCDKRYQWCDVDVLEMWQKMPTMWYRCLRDVTKMPTMWCRCLRDVTKNVYDASYMSERCDKRCQQCHTTFLKFSKTKQLFKVSSFTRTGAVILTFLVLAWTGPITSPSSDTISNGPTG